MRRNAFVFRILFCFGLGTSVSACGGENAAVSREQHVRICEYDDFSVDVTSGPSSGLHLAGSLLLEEYIPSGGLSGALRGADGKLTPVTGAVYKNGDIALTFNTETGYVMGLGALGDKFCKSGAKLEGVAVGPRVSTTNMIGDSDSGHWILLSPNLILEPPTLTLEPINPSAGLISGAGSGFLNAVTCQAGATQVSGSCCTGNVGGGATSTTCTSGGVTCTTTHTKGYAGADLCCDGDSRGVPDCAAGQSQIQG